MEDEIAKRRSGGFGVMMIFSLVAALLGLGLTQLLPIVPN
jgi:hypothetical protein